MAGDREVIPRPAARVLLCDPAGRILLFRAQFNDREFWITPGGGVNEAESYEEGAARELWEETGLVLDDGEDLVCVWTRSHVFEFRGRVIDQQERFYLLHCIEAPEISDAHWEEEERNDLLEYRWWSAAEIEASDDVFAPGRLGILLRELLLDGVPSEPIDVGL